MPEIEIIQKLTGCSFMGYRIKEFIDEGKEHVVFRVTHNSDSQEFVLKLYQSNPMFFLNEVDFQFLPPETGTDTLRERCFVILEKLILNCERPSPGLFFVEMRCLYARILFGLYEDFIKHQMPVIDVTTLTIQNNEFSDFARQTALRLRTINYIEREEWEYFIRNPEVIEQIGMLSPNTETSLNFNLPTSLLFLLFCGGFFGEIPEISGSLERFLNLLSDTPPLVEAEQLLSQFLELVDFRDVVPSVEAEILTLQGFLQELRTVLQSDMLDYVERLSKFEGGRFIADYRKGRNRILQALPRYIRVIKAHIH